MSTPFIRIPEYNADTDTWGHREFLTRDDMTLYVRSIFKEPGKYEFNSCSVKFNEQARNFRKQKYFCDAPQGSKDFIKYWDDQKDRCRHGAIYVSGDHTWYLTRDYYMWLNFLPIYDKEKKDFDFPMLRDAQYHMALYEMIAELEYKHVPILKKRQIASSYFHAAKLLNGFWFERGFVGKMGANLKDYINEKGTWLFLNEYANFLDTHTAWYRPRQPDKVFAWLQMIEVTLNGRKQERGLKSRITGMSFEKDPTNGVGGPCSIFFHEEGGIAPHADTTYEFIRPALSSGDITTGIFIIAGSVGDLDQCDPLKKFILKPEGNGFLGVETDLLNDKGERAICGLFIPEQWSMPPYIDEYGNSLVKEALAAIAEKRAQWKKDLDPEQYQLRISQQPINIEEAFAYRKVSKFPTAIIQRQIDRIDQKEYPYEILSLGHDEKGAIEAKESRRLPISEFPVPKNLANKEGALVVWERPIKDAPWGTYYASIDPVSDGKTTTSDSLASIFILKTPIEATIHKPDGTTAVRIEGDEIVASWCGRYDDINDTHNLLEIIIEWYQAWTLVEVNVSLFIQHMIAKRKQKYLVTKDQVVFLKEIGANTQSYQDYGWKNTGSFFKQHLINYSINYCKEAIDQEFDEKGRVIFSKLGVTRIKDKMLLKEMLAYHDGLNVDRLVAFTALVAFAKMQLSNRGYRKTTEYTKKDLEKLKDLYNLKVDPFRHLGHTKSTTSAMSNPNRSPFKNLR